MRYTFDEVRAALDEYWGLRLSRSGSDGHHVNGKDGRWDVSHSLTGFIVTGQIPGFGYSSIRYRSLAQIVRSCELKNLIKQARKAGGK